MEEPEPKTKKTDDEIVREFEESLRKFEEWAEQATDEEFRARWKPGNVTVEEYERRFGPIHD